MSQYARQINIRLDEATAKQLADFEQATTVEGISLVRAALKAALDEFTRSGRLELPLRVVSSSSRSQSTEEKKQSPTTTDSPPHQTAGTAASPPPTTEAGKIISGPTPRQPDAGLATSRAHTTTPPPPNIVALNEDSAEYGRPKKKKK